MMHPAIRTLAASCLILLAPLRMAGQDTLSKPERIAIGGYIKSMQGLYVPEDLDQLTTLNQIHHRLNAAWSITPDLSLRVGMRNRILWGDQLRYIPDREAALDGPTECADLSILWVNEPAFAVHTIFDRLALQYARKRWDVRVGRQRINWGMHPVWNPNDIFNAYSILDFDYEERPGSDALRAQYFLNGLSAVEVAWSCGSGAGSTYAAYYRMNAAGYDIQVFGGRAGMDLVAGGGWAGNIGDAGFKGEATWFHPAGDRPDSLASFSLTLGVDRTFKGNWYASAGWLYQSSAYPTGRIQDWVTGTALSAKTLMPFEISWYGAVTKAFSPVSTLNLSFIYSPKNTSLILLPSYSRNLMDNLDLDIFLQSFFADTGTAYKSAGQAFFLRFRWSY
jgi:hypothetical protein